MEKDFNVILDDCIDGINHGEAIEVCLAKYPEHAAQLEPLLRAVLQTKLSYSFSPGTDAKRMARQRLYTAIDKQRQPSFWQRMSAHRVAFTSLASVLILFAVGYVTLRATVFVGQPPGAVVPGLSGPGGDTGLTSPAAGIAGNTGMVQMWVTDAPRSDNVTEIWVTVSEVKIHEATGGQISDNGSAEAEGEIDVSTNNSGWISVNLTGPNRFDLLTLSGGLQQVLAAADLPAGQYTQIRMTVGKVEVKINGVLKDATLPSGKLKFVHPFDVEAGNVTKLLFDFDADQFVNVTGSPQEPKIMVKPVVKLIVSKPQAGPESGVKITTPSLPNGGVGASYNVALAATGGTLPYTWRLLSGNLTSGLTLSPAGFVSGTPNAGTAGNYTFVVKVSDNATPAKSATKQYKITIAAAGAVIITTASLADGKSGAAYTATLGALGGTLPYTWNITRGNLPNGLSLNATTGVISGTPAKNGNSNFTIKVSDNATPANTDTEELNIRIADK